MIASLTNPEVWWALFQISIINILLSGDNAVVIALACRGLPAKQAKLAFGVGAIGIIVLMTALTAAAAYLLSLPYLELVGSVLLLWIGVKLMVAEDESDEGDDSKTTSNFWEAVKIIIIADIVMSLDNVLGMAGAAKGHLWMLFIGMVITIPLILFGSAIIMKLMERFPILITLGAALLGYVAGEMAVSDPVVKDFIETKAAFLDYAVPIAGALIVVITGKIIERRARAKAKATVMEMAGGSQAETAKRS
jgi:YjbE family integral membrane protein